MAMTKRISGTSLPHWRSGLLVAFVGWACCSVFLQRAWSGEKAKLNDVAIAAAAKYSQQTGGYGLIIKEGRFVRFEERARGVPADNRFVVYSITKTLVGLLAMVAESEKLLRLDEPASETLVEWKNDPARRGIRIIELLSMTSGLPTGIDTLYVTGLVNKNKRALQIKAIASPGGIFCYGPAGFEVFEELLRRKLVKKGMSPLGYMQNKVLSAIGATARNWRCDSSGNAYFSTGARLTIRQMVMLGELIKNQGGFSLRQTIPSKAIAQLWQGQNSMPFYHMGVWFNRNAGKASSKVIDVESSIGTGKPTAVGFWKYGCLSVRAPQDLVAMIGSNGQRIYVCPSKDLVIVRTGKGRGFRDAEFLDRLFR